MNNGWLALRLSLFSNVPVLYRPSVDSIVYHFGAVQVMDKVMVRIMSPLLPPLSKELIQKRALLRVSGARFAHKRKETK